MIEKIILKYLSEKKIAPVYMETPEKPPEKYIVVTKTGSSGENKVNSAVVVVQCIAESLLSAAELNETVKDAMGNIVELNEIVKIELNTDYPYTDTQTKIYRYQAVFDVTHY